MPGHAIVVGSGPNGLAAGIELAQAGYRVQVFEAASTVGGGSRSAELTLPGLVHDICSAFHPTGVTSPFFAAQDLARYGLRWAWPEIEMAHPFADGSAAVLHRSVEQTADALGGADGEAWLSLFGPFVERWDALAAEIFQPVVHLPRHPLPLARFGMAALQPATLLARRWQGEAAKALLLGTAAHIGAPLERPLSASAGLMLATAGQVGGWPVAVGGSQAIANALAARLQDLGGTIECDHRVTDDRPLRGADLVMFDTSARALATIAGDRLPRTVRRSYRRFRHGPGSAKLDLAVRGGIPWTNPDCRRAGTIHLGGSIEELTAAERATHRGVFPDTPFVLVGQQALADPERGVDDLVPIWAYTHVPAADPADVSEAIIDRIEEFAPGFRSRIVASSYRSAEDLGRYNANYVGGDIATGGSDGLQLVARPRLRPDPYWTGIPGWYLCSAATPPGGGVHGMCGYRAARAALRRVRSRP